jgi:hypothetical protein
MFLFLSHFECFLQAELAETEDYIAAVAQLAEAEEQLKIE